MSDLDAEVFGYGVEGFTLPFGYVDPSGNVHREIILREMTGKDEDEMENSNLITTERVSRLLISCTEKLGTIIDKNTISSAITGDLDSGLPLTSQDRLSALLYLRRVTLGSIYKFERKCPKCGELNKNKQLDLREIIFEKKDASRRVAKISLPRSHKVAVIKVITAREERQILLQSPENNSLKSYAVLARVIELDNKKMSITPECLEIVKKLHREDRDYIIQVYTLMEGGADTDIQVTCKNSNCKIEFELPLDLGQTFFLQPGKETKYGGSNPTLGSRFFAFLPVGNRARLEHDCICLAEAYQWSPDQVMALPVSRRNRFIKMREMIIEAQKNRSTGLPGGNLKTGID